LGEELILGGLHLSLSFGQGEFLSSPPLRFAGLGGLLGVGGVLADGSMSFLVHLLDLKRDLQNKIRTTFEEALLIIFIAFCVKTLTGQIPVST